MEENEEVVEKYIDEFITEKVDLEKEGQKQCLRNIYRNVFIPWIEKKKYKRVSEMNFKTYFESDARIQPRKKVKNVNKQVYYLCEFKEN
jgi:hypothetical protein